MNAQVIAVDVESTGLSPERHFAWDIAIVTSSAEHQWFIKPSLATADPYALRVGRYYERTKDLLDPLPLDNEPRWSEPAHAAAELAQMLDGATLIGHNVPFDADFIGAFLRANGHILTADHHMVNVADLVTGYIAGQRRAAKAAQANAAINRERVAGWEPAAWPAGRHLTDVAQAVGVNVCAFEQHTALGDAALAMAVYRAVMDGAA